LSWPPKAVGGALQLLGILLTLLGVAVVRSSLELAVNKAIEAKQGLDRWWALSQEGLGNWWAHRRGRPAAMRRFAADALQTTDAAVATAVRRARVDRETVSDREWLIHLDDRLYNLHELVDRAERSRSAERDELDRRFIAQRDELRAEIQRETRQGWQLIVAGLAWSAAGTIVGIFG
jgi:hypothetical protein